MKEKLVTVHVLLPENTLKILRKRALATRTPMSTYLRNIIIKTEIHHENPYAVESVKC